MSEILETLNILLGMDEGNSPRQFNAAILTLEEGEVFSEAAASSCGIERRQVLGHHLRRLVQGCSDSRNTTLPEPYYP